MKDELKNFGLYIILGGIFEAAVAVVAILLFIRGGGGSWRQVGLSIVVLGASATVGAVGGFLFGAPRSRSGQNAAQAYQPNSNLEQVSDWLTKIVVGVSLVEFRNLAGALWSIAQQLGVFFGDAPTAPGPGAAYGLGLLVGGTLLSFQLTYMWTYRLYDILMKSQRNRSDRSL